MTKRLGMKEGAERRSKIKPKEPSEYMKGVYSRIVAAKAPKKKSLPLDKNLSGGELKAKLGSSKPR